MNTEFALTPELSYLEQVKNRVSFYGAEEAEIKDLLAIIIGKNDSVLVSRLIDLELHQLVNMSAHEFLDIEGINLASAYRLEAAIGLAKRLMKHVDAGGYYANSSTSAMRYFEWMKYETQETLVSLYLDAKGRVIGRKTIYVGGLHSSPAHPREIFREAVRRSAAKVIIAHSHPSGNPSPSRSDVEFTEFIVKAGEIVGIQVVDHIVVGREGSISMQEEGYLAF